MSTELGSYRLITVHAPFLTIAPNQKSLSNCCMEALSHWPEMKNLGRCSTWNFTKNYCTYKCHTLRVYRPPKVLLQPFPNNISFSFLLPKNKPTQSATIVLTLWTTNCKVAFWFGAIARKGASTVIGRSFACSADIVAWPVQRWFAHRGKFQKLFNCRGEIINLGF